MRRVSRPGEPPAAPRGSPLNDLLVFVYDRSSDSVLVGPVGFRGSRAPSVLEFGGRVIVLTRSGNVRRRVPADIRPRPYMRPALSRSLAKIPRQFRDQVR